MKFSFLKPFLSAVALTLFVGGMVNADTLNFELVGADDPNQIGAALNNTAAGDATFALTDPAGVTVTIDEVVLATLGPGDTAADPAIFSALGARFGIDSGDEGFSTGGTLANDESFDLSFSEAVVLTEVFFGSLSGGDSIDFGAFDGITIDDAPGSIFDLTSGGTTSGIELAAGESITIAANVGSVGLRTITFEASAAAVPEPSSVALLGLLGLGAIARRRR